MQLNIADCIGGLRGVAGQNTPPGGTMFEKTLCVPWLDCKYITTFRMLVPFLFSIAPVLQTFRLRHCLIVRYLSVMLQDKRKTIQTTDALFTRDLPSAITNKIPTSCLFSKRALADCLMMMRTTPWYRDAIDLLPVKHIFMTCGAREKPSFWSNCLISFFNI